MEVQEKTELYITPMQVLGNNWSYFRSSFTSFSLLLMAYATELAMQQIVVSIVVSVCIDDSTLRFAGKAQTQTHSPEKQSFGTNI